MSGGGRKKQNIQPQEFGKKPLPNDGRDMSKLTATEIRALIQDLRIHQVELETTVEELKQSQSELQLSRDKYQQLYDSVPVGYITIDNYNSILEANATAARILGVSRSHLLKSQFTSYLASTQESQDSFYLHTRKALQTHLPQDSELEMQRSEGKRFWALLQIMPVNTTSKQSIKLQIAFSDISERKQKEADKDKYRDEIEKRVEERTRSLSQANKKLKEYSYRITQVQEEERGRIARELHDDTAQNLALLSLEISSLLDSPEIQSEKIKDKLKHLKEDTDRAIADVRRYSHALRPGVLDLGLEPALDLLTSEANEISGMDTRFESQGETKILSSDIQLAFFRIAQEAVTNARKHAGASLLIVELTYLPDKIIMSIADNGKGFNLEEANKVITEKGSLGLIGMQERSELIGADLKIKSHPGKGTTISVELDC